MVMDGQEWRNWNRRIKEVKGKERYGMEHVEGQIKQKAN